jgi:hypothetical protein
MSTSLSNNARAPYHLTLPDSVAQAGTFFFLLFVFMWPFQLVPFLTDNLFGIQGFKLFNLLSAVVLAYLSSYTRPTKSNEHPSEFFSFTSQLLPSPSFDAHLLHSRFPVSFPESYFDFVLSACIVQTFYTLSFLFTLKRMCSFQELERIMTVICLSILLLSIAFVAVVLTNPSVLLSGHPGMTDNDRGRNGPVVRSVFWNPLQCDWKHVHFYCTLVALSSSYARRSLDRTPVSVAPGGSSPRVTNRACHSSGLMLPISDPAAQVCHFSSWCCGGWRHIVGVDRANR